VAYAASRTDGAFHFGTRVPAGAVVRAVALGATSRPVRR
jgi:hypothetical protein